MDELEIITMAADLREWISESENFLVMEFIASRDMSKDEFMEMVDEHDVLRKAYGFAMTQQEQKLMNGGLGGMVDKTMALRILEQYSGWKSDGAVVGNAYQRYFAEAAERAMAPVETSSTPTDSLTHTDTSTDTDLSTDTDHSAPKDGNGKSS